MFSFLHLDPGSGVAILICGWGLIVAALACLFG